MADFAPGWKLGETRSPPFCITAVAQYGGTIAAGDLLKITAGTNGKITVTEATGDGDNVSAVALYAGVSGDTRNVLVLGLVKVTSGTGIGAGAVVKSKAGKAVASGTASSSASSIGFNFGGAVAAANDTFILYFNPGGN